MAYVPQGREIIPYLTVEENLMLGMESLPGGLSKNKKIDTLIYDLFPILREKRYQLVVELSGGQRQQVALGRALMVIPYNPYHLPRPLLVGLLRPRHPMKQAEPPQIFPLLVYLLCDFFFRKIL